MFALKRRPPVQIAVWQCQFIIFAAGFAIIEEGEIHEGMVYNEVGLGAADSRKLSRKKPGEWHDGSPKNESQRIP
jgi:hypothetical protein